MGWLFQNDKLRHQTPVEYITREFTHDNGTTAATVISAAAVGSTIYAAIRNHDKTTGKSYVFCAVILFKNNERDGFGYKDMDESMGPCEVDCPDRIMRLLSPFEELPNPGYAGDWRKSVATAKTKKAETRSKISRLAIGDKVKLTHPAHFRSSGIEADSLTVIRFDKRTPIFVADQHPSLICRLRKATLAGAAISRR
jgi:hypothetical protein